MNCSRCGYDTEVFDKLQRAARSLIARAESETNEALAALRRVRAFCEDSWSEGLGEVGISDVLDAIETGGKP